jgi:hypothetical protein
MSGAVTTRSTPLSPTTFAEAERFAEMMAESTMVPPDFRGKPANIMFAMQFGAELGLSPLQSLQSISNINGKWAVYGDALLAIVLASPLCEDVIERLDGEDDNLRAICEARRRGAAPKIQMFSVADAKKASLWGKQGPWTQYPRRMLQWRARGFALRDAFPDLLRGVITVEEARDIPESGMVDVTPPAPEPLGADLDAFAAPEPPPPHDPVTGEVLEPHALPGSIADYHPTQWGGKFVEAVRTATSQREMDAWVLNNAGILDDMKEHFPRAWLSIDQAMAAHRASLGPDDPELPGAAIRRDSR